MTYEKNLFIEILYQYNEHKLDAITYDGESIYNYINSILFKAGYTFLKPNSLRPYIDVGIGISQVKLGNNKSSRELSLFPGVGVKYSIMKKVKLKIFFEYAFIGKKYFSGEYLKYFPLQIGVEYSL